MHIDATYFGRLRKSFSSVLAAMLVFACAVSDSAPRSVRVGVYENKPKVFTDDNGRPAGLFIDLVSEFARKEGWNIEYVNCEWSECLADLEKGRIDLMPDVAYSTERDNIFDFHKIPVAESWSQIYANPEVPVSRISDLNEKRVALLRDSIQQKALQQTMKGFGYDIKIVPADSFDEAFRMVKEGSADATIANHFYGDFVYQDYGLVKTTVIFNVVSLYYAAPQGRNAYLLETIDRYLGAWIKEPDSPYYRILSRWAEKPPTRIVPSYFLWILGSVAGLLVFAFGIIYLLRRQVMARTKHLVKANDELKKTEDMLNLALEATKDGVWDWRPKTGRLIWSPSACTMLGYQAGEFPADFDKWAELIHPDDREKTVTEVKSHINMGDRTFSVVFRQKRKDGNWIWINGRGKVVELDENGEPQRVMGIQSDITEQKNADDELKKHRERLEELVTARTNELVKIQQQLIQSQKMEAIGQLAGGISHDFNNMLAVILGTSELISGNLSEDDPNYARINRVIKTGKRAKDLTGRLLTFARKETLEISNTSINDILLDTVDILLSSITKKIAIQTTVSDEGLAICGDANQLCQAFLNLCINACDAMKEGGTLKITALPVSLDNAFCKSRSGLHPGDYCLIEIIDEGSGMPKEMLDRIFEPFFTTKKKGVGTGLGLSVTEGIVKMHNGHIEFESEVGKGTKVKVYLPTTALPVESTQTKTLEFARQGNHETILIVDDEKDFTDMMTDFLFMHGYNPIAANSGRDAINIFRDQKDDIGLVILDIMMPGMDGGEVFEALRDVSNKLKVVLCSGYSDEGKAKNIMDKGACAFIQKPYSSQNLLKTIDELLRK